MAQRQQAREDRGTGGGVEAVEIMQEKLQLLSQLEKTYKINIQDGKATLDRNGGWFQGVDRWMSGQGREVTVRWLQELAVDVKNFAQHYQQVSRDRGSDVQVEESADRRDACTQCGRAGSCPCLSLGVLRELLVDLDAACPKMKLLEQTYAGDIETANRIRDVVKELDGVRVALRGDLQDALP